MRLLRKKRPSTTLLQLCIALGSSFTNGVNRESPSPPLASEVTDLLPAHPQRIRHAINIIKPGSNQSNLQDPAIVKPCRPQPLNIILQTLVASLVSFTT